METYKINITDEDGILLNQIIIDPEEMNWDTPNTKGLLINEIFDEIKKDIINKKEKENKKC